MKRVMSEEEVCLESSIYSLGYVDFREKGAWLHFYIRYRSEPLEEHEHIFSPGFDVVMDYVSVPIPKVVQYTSLRKWLPIMTLEDLNGNLEICKKSGEDSSYQLWWDMVRRRVVDGFKNLGKMTGLIEL